MSNSAVAEKLPGAEELDELYRLDASETNPEDEPGDGGEGDDEGGAQPDEMPHPIPPEEMPHP
jgi:hypothetical protein